MMRRVLIFLFVLGVMSSANALVVSMEPSGTGAHAPGDVIITVDSDSDDVSYEFYLVLCQIYIFTNWDKIGAGQCFLRCFNSSKNGQTNRIRVESHFKK